MKKITVLLAFIMMAGAAFSQTDNFKPYVGAGTSLSSGGLTHGAELGVYNSKAWYAVGVSTPEGSGTYYASAKAYYKVRKLTTSSVDVFGYGAVNVALDDSRSLSVEPGIAAVFNVTKKFAPQISLGFPLNENTAIYKTLPLSFGLSLNYWIK